MFRIFVEAQLRVAKREGKLEVFEVMKETTMTFKELATWYLDLVSIKKLTSYDRVKGLIENFNKEFGDKPVSSIKPWTWKITRTSATDREPSLQPLTWKLVGCSSMIRKAFDNDKR